MGEVWKARDRLLNRIVALKFISATSGLASRDLLHEARAASSLNHPNIVTIFQIAEGESDAYLAMEFVEGESLRQRLQRQPLAFGEALDIATQMVTALASAHAHGIVHRDLKPENIMLRIDGCVKLVDFGLAKVLPWEQGSTGDHTFDTNSSGQLVGTFNYMSPEQARGQPVTAASDVFALGIVLYEMFTGQHPFGRASVIETLNAIIRDDPPEMSGRSPATAPAISSIVAKALRKEPTQRYQSASELDAQFRIALRASATSVGETRRTPARARALWMRVVGAVALVALAIVTAWTVLVPGGDLSQTPVQSVAIMNFRSQPDDSRAAMLAEELPEDLSSALSTAGLQVASRRSVTELGPGATARNIGEDLGVDAVLEGTVRSSSDGLRIYIELVNVRTQFQIWSGTFSADAMATADRTIAPEITSRIHAALQGR